MGWKNYQRHGYGKDTGYYYGKIAGGDHGA